MTLPPVGILCGGRATRLGPIAGTLPKALVPVAAVPFLEHRLRQLVRQGFEEMVLLVGHRGDQIRAFAGDGSRFGANISYADDGAAPLGTGGALRKALALLGDCFFVTYGDSYLECDAKQMWERFCASGAAAMMAVLRNAGRWGVSNVVFDGERVLRHDKSVKDLPGMDWIDWGMTIFSAEII